MRIDKKYYFSGKPNFGLLSHDANRFLLMSDNYQALKITQLCFMRNFLPYILDFTKIENRIPENFDNSNILNYGLTGAKQLHIFPDVVENRYSWEKIIRSTEPTELDIVLQEKIMFVFGLINLTLNLHKSMCVRIEKKIKLIIDGLEISKDFFNLTIGSDETRNKIIDRDIKDYQTPLLAADQIKKIVFTSLVNKNYDFNLSQIKSEIKNDLNTIEDFDPDIKKSKKLLLEYMS